MYLLHPGYSLPLLRLERPAADDPAPRRVAVPPFRFRALERPPGVFAAPATALSTFSGPDMTDVDSLRASRLASLSVRSMFRARIVPAHVEQEVAGRGGGPIPATEDEIQAEIRRQAEELAAQGLETSVEMRSVMLGGPAMGSQRSPPKPARI